MITAVANHAIWLTLVPRNSYCIPLSQYILKGKPNPSRPDFQTGPPMGSEIKGFDPSKYIGEGTFLTAEMSSCASFRHSTKVLM